MRPPERSSGEVGCRCGGAPFAVNSENGLRTDLLGSRYVGVASVGVLTTPGPRQLNSSCRGCPRRWGVVHVLVTDPCRDDFPNNFVGDLVRHTRGWVVVPPTCCPEGHDYGDTGWSVSSVWCTCNGRHTARRYCCGATLYAPQPGPPCCIRDSWAGLNVGSRTTPARRLRTTEAEAPAVPDPPVKFRLSRSGVFMACDVEGSLSVVPMD